MRGGWGLLAGVWLAAALLAIVSLGLGAVRIGLPELGQALLSPGADSLEARIVWQFRLPKTLTAIFAGMSLGISGLLMQSIFRNPLAGPYVLGISSGASLGVAVLVLGAEAGMVGAWSLAVSSWLGAGAVLLGVLWVSRRVSDSMTVLVLGILFGAVASSVVGILQYFSPASQLKSFVVWTLGSLGGVGPSQLGVLAAASLGASLLALGLSKGLDGSLLGDEGARALGQDPRRLRALAFVSTSIMAGTVTAFCGPIGFVGIVVPHLARMLSRGSRHLLLIPLSGGIGALVMVAADMASLAAGAEQPLPINSITALAGVPMVAWILLSKRRLQV